MNFGMYITELRMIMSQKVIIRPLSQHFSYVLSIPDGRFGHADLITHFSDKERDLGKLIMLPFAPQ